jgi:GTP-binding protein HflX
MIEVWNKIDRLDAEGRAQLARIAGRRADHPIVPVSAQTGEGVEELLAIIEARLAKATTTLELSVDSSDGAGLSWLHRHTEVLDRRAENGVMVMTVRVDDARLDSVLKKFKTGNEAS